MWGGVLLTTARKWMKECPWDPMLLKVISRSIKIMTKCKSSPYLQNLLIYWDLKFCGNNIFLYFDLRKLPYLAQFLRYKGHILDLVLLLCPLKIMFSNLGSRINFQKFPFFSTLRDNIWKGLRNFGHFKSFFKTLCEYQDYGEFLIRGFKRIPTAHDVRACYRVYLM